MRTSNLLSAATLGVALLLGAATTIPAQAQTAMPGTAAGESAAVQAALTIKQIYDKLEAAGYTNITEIERERTTYEAKATDTEGVVTKLELDATSGEIINTRQKNKRR